MESISQNEGVCKLAIKFSQDTKALTSKPDKIETAKVTARIKMAEKTVEQIAQDCITGFTWCPAYFSNGRKNETWVAQTLFALDIDCGLSFTDCLKRCKEYEIIPAFAYSTFSSIDNNKYRLVFISPVEITDFRVRTVIQESLQRLFPEADKTRDAARFFYGGNDVIFESYNATFDIVQLIKSMVRFIQDTDINRNAPREIKNWCSLVGLDMINGYPAVIQNEWSEDKAKIDESVLFTLRYKGYLSPFRQNCEVVFKFTPSATDSKARTYNKKYKDTQDHTTAKRELLQNVDYEELYNTCPVFRDFMDGKDIHHNVTWWIASNLVFLKGGETKFFEGLHKREVYNDDKWKSEIAYMKRVYDNPTNYSKLVEFYPDIESIVYAKNLVSLAKKEKGKIMITEPYSPIALDVAEQRLQDAFNTALSAQDKNIHVIKAPTGIGKTRLYEGLQGATIAVPYHTLKDEVYERMIQAGNTALVSPDLPDSLNEVEKSTLESLYLMGAIKSANVYLRKLSQNDEAVAEYIKQKDATSHITNKNVIVTHARLPYLQATNEVIVIDEDIMPTLFTQGYVKISDILLFRDALAKKEIYTCGLGGFGNRSKKERSVLHSVFTFIDESLYGLVYALPNFRLSDTEQRELESLLVGSGIKGNVLGLLSSTHFMKEDDNIYFVSRRFLPKDKKIIILSATANKWIYNKVFGDKVVFSDVGDTELTGKIKQVSNIKTSRDALDKAPETIDLLNTLVGETPVFTYKDTVNKFKNPAGYFGHLQGLDAYKGKDIAVIGTPHLDPKAYLLLASALGLHVGTADYQPLTYTRIKRNGYDFYFMTYSRNGELQEIQMHLIESELSQAIGRARALRYDAEVLVISNLPIPGAEFYKYDAHAKTLERHNLAG